MSEGYAEVAVIGPAVATAVTLANTLIDAGFKPPCSNEAGELGFAYTLQQDVLGILVTWEGEPCLVVRFHQRDDVATYTMGAHYQVFVADGPWIEELSETLTFLQRVLAARKERLQ